MKRSVVLCILLSIITCGWYTIYWFVVLNDDINQAANTPNDTSGVLALVLSLVTCGLYTYYWMYKMGNKLDYATGQNQSRALLYIILSLVGFGFISFVLMQDSLNKI